MAAGGDQLKVVLKTGVSADPEKWRLVDAALL